MVFDIHSQADHPVVLDLGEDGSIYLMPRETVRGVDAKHLQNTDIVNAVRTRTIRTESIVEDSTKAADVDPEAEHNRHSGILGALGEAIGIKGKDTK